MSMRNATHSMSERRRPLNHNNQSDQFPGSSPPCASFTLSAISLFVGLTLMGCPYSFKSTGEPTVKTVAIQQFSNQTVETGVADKLTELVIDALLRDGTMKVVGQSSAEGLLVGALTAYQRVPFTFNEADQVREYAVKLSIEVTLSSKDGSELWKDTFSHEGVYNAATETEEDGQTRAVALLVTDILNKTTKSW